MMAGLKIRKIAEERGITISRLQMDARVAVRTMRRYWFMTKTGNVEGERLEELHLDVLQRIADALGVKPSELIED